MRGKGSPTVTLDGILISDWVRADDACPSLVKDGLGCFRKVLEVSESKPQVKPPSLLDDLLF